MKKQIKNLTEKEIADICNAQPECFGCPMSVFIDEEGIVGICSADVAIVGPTGLHKLAEKLEEEIDILEHTECA